MERLSFTLSSHQRKCDQQPNNQLDLDKKNTNLDIEYLPRKGNFLT